MVNNDTQFSMLLDKNRDYLYASLTRYFTWGDKHVKHSFFSEWDKYKKILLKETHKSLTFHVKHYSQSRTNTNVEIDRFAAITHFIEFIEKIDKLTERQSWRHKSMFNYKTFQKCLLDELDLAKTIIYTRSEFNRLIRELQNIIGEGKDLPRDLIKSQNKFNLMITSATGNTLEYNSHRFLEFVNSQCISINLFIQSLHFTQVLSLPAVFLLCRSIDPWSQVSHPRLLNCDYGGDIFTIDVDFSLPSNHTFDRMYYYNGALPITELLIKHMKRLNEKNIDIPGRVRTDYDDFHSSVQNVSLLAHSLISTSAIDRTGAIERLLDFIHCMDRYFDSTQWRNSDTFSYDEMLDDLQEAIGFREIGIISNKTLEEIVKEFENLPFDLEGAHDFIQKRHELENDVVEVQRIIKQFNGHVDANFTDNVTITYLAEVHELYKKMQVFYRAYNIYWNLEPLHVLFELIEYEEEGGDSDDEKDNDNSDDNNSDDNNSDDNNSDDNNSDDNDQMRMSDPPNSDPEDD